MSFFNNFFIWLDVTLSCFQTLNFDHWVKIVRSRFLNLLLKNNIFEFKFLNFWNFCQIHQNFEKLWLYGWKNHNENVYCGVYTQSLMCAAFLLVKHIFWWLFQHFRWKTFWIFPLGIVNHISLSRWRERISISFVNDAKQERGPSIWRNQQASSTFDRKRFQKSHWNDILWPGMVPFHFKVKAN